MKRVRRRRRAWHRSMAPKKPALARREPQNPIIRMPAMRTAPPTPSGSERSGEVRLHHKRDTRSVRSASAIEVAGISGRLVDPFGNQPTPDHH